MAPVELIDSISYFSIQVDKCIQAKVSRSLTCLKYEKKFLSNNVLCKLCRCIVEAHFRYCCSVWENCTELRLIKLQKLQNRGVRIITKSNYDTPLEVFVKELK